MVNLGLYLTITFLIQTLKITKTFMIKSKTFMVYHYHLGINFDIFYSIFQLIFCLDVPELIDIFLLIKS
jgi:hypothetical protein